MAKLKNVNVKICKQFALIPILGASIRMTFAKDKHDVMIRYKNTIDVHFSVFCT